MINYTDRMTLSVLVGDVRRDLGLDEQDYSQIVSIFFFSYAIMYAASGYIVDRLGTRKGLAIFVFGWSIAQMLHGMVRSKWPLAGCRFLLGLTEPGSFPAATKAIREWFPVEQRAIGVGIFNAGSSLGAAVASPLAAFIALRYGWRTAFVFTGALGLVWLVFWLLIYRTPNSETVQARPRVDWKAVLRDRNCLILILVRFLCDPVIYFVIFWLPAYLQKERGFDLEMIGRYAWMPYVFGDVGYVVGGWLSGRLIRAGWTIHRARRAAMAIGAALVPCAILTPMLPTAGLAIAAMCIVVFGNAIWVSNLLTLPADLFPENEVGTASGFSGMGGSFGGTLANLATGYVVTHFSYQPVFVWAGLMHPLGLWFVWRIIRDRTP